MKGIPARYGEHRIDLLDEAVPIRQRQYRLNPKYSLLVKEEIDKYLSAGIIYPVLSSEWVSPIVIVPKKLTGKIRVCQDFRKLNAATRKDHHPLPFTDAILDHVAGHECYSFLDGFSGYNQVSIREQDKDKTTFTTDWGTYAYHKMPFGLCNAPATFQRMMTNIFQEQLRKFLEIFIDDFCVFGKRSEHLSHLKQTFDKCRESSLSLHPEKCFFFMTSGILLGHRVSSDGIAVDIEKVKVILELEPPTNLRELRAFLGHVGYYRRFIHMYAILAADLTKLLKKDEPYAWGAKQQSASGTKDSRMGLSFPRLRRHLGIRHRCRSKSEGRQQKGLPDLFCEPSAVASRKEVYHDGERGIGNGVFLHVRLAKTNGSTKFQVQLTLQHEDMGPTKSYARHNPANFRRWESSSAYRQRRLPPRLYRQSRSTTKGPPYQ
ncbi:hypothetical protein AXG93_4040s1030 [Marchantia polymorpha subsp. ruderalis]|uniref:Reverse transcriptase domain-containing protein n=1 Tax=Marchantia polymorpha subsp. ruderalis TaxID=1480154 RepID=A0A176VXQ4_MARPO|nr:hypothetical protein AXG93_4040s1030 [Marchantia polymorpha subsp. ruderalis]